MTPANLEANQKRTVRFQQGATFAFLLYVLYLLGHSAWQSAHSTAQLQGLKDQISAITAQNQELENTILYQKTDSYRELEARRQLGLKKPGELVLALPPEPSDTTSTTTKPAVIGEPVKATASELLEVWWSYFVS